jgi:hypothetical protein
MDERIITIFDFVLDFFLGLTLVVFGVGAEPGKILYRISEKVTQNKKDILFFLARDSICVYLSFITNRDLRKKMK